MSKTPRIRALIFRISLILYIILVAYLCFANFNSLPDVPRQMFGIRMDKIVHFCMFFPFPVLCFFAYDKMTDTPLQALGAILTVLSFGCIFAGLTEIIQGTMPYRTEDIKDFYADITGMGCSSVITYIVDVSKMGKKNKKKRK